MRSYVKKYVFRGIEFKHKGVQKEGVPCGETLSLDGVAETN